MINLFLPITYLNNSLQVGDLVYASRTYTQPNSEDQQSQQTDTGATEIVGILRRITAELNGFILDVDETPFINNYIPVPGDFIMFSKYSQTDGDVIGYYAKARFTNDSREEAEIYSVGSEVIINSK
jgi:hypothetical protein